MLDTSEEQTFSLAYADHRLEEEVHPPGSSSQKWRVARLHLAKLALEGHEQARRLTLWVDVVLRGSADSERSLRVRLASDVWAQAESWPPCVPAEQLAQNGAPPQRDTLAYTVTEVIPGEGPASSEEGFWQTFLQTSPEPAPRGLPTPAVGQAAGEAGEEEDLLAALQRWMATELRVDTVRGALRCVEFGEAGVFGPLKRVVLRRSGQPDLEIDATLLGEVNDAEDRGGEPALILELYGDRHGAWVLHRRRLGARKRRTDTEPAPLYECDVLIADNAADLVAAAGLGVCEKKLFQAVGVLPNETLREHYVDAAAEEEGSSVARMVDLSSVPDRSRRYLDAIITLAQGNKLNTQDLDALLRTARLLSRANR